MAKQQSAGDAATRSYEMFLELERSWLHYLGEIDDGKLADFFYNLAIQRVERALGLDNVDVTMGMDGLLAREREETRLLRQPGALDRMRGLLASMEQLQHEAHENLLRELEEQAQETEESRESEVE